MKLLKIGTILLVVICGLSVLSVLYTTQGKGSYKITGLVQYNGDPLSGAKVFTMAIDRPSPKLQFATADEKGRFTLTDVQEGRNTVYVLNDDSYPNLTSIAGVGRGQVSVDVNDQNASPDVVVIAQDQKPVITGRIADKKARNDAEVRMCLVSDSTKCSGAFINSDGTFMVTAPEEPFTFSVTSKGKSFKTDVGQLRRGETRKVDVVFN